MIKRILIVGLGSIGKRHLRDRFIGWEALARERLVITTPVCGINQWPALARALTVGVDAAVREMKSAVEEALA